MVALRNNLSRCRVKIYLDGVQRRMPNLRSSLDDSSPKHQEINEKVEVTRRTLRTIEHSPMVHASVLEACIHFSLIYTTYHIFMILPIKNLITKDGELTTPFKLATGKKSSLSHLSVLFRPCVVR